MAKQKLHILHIEDDTFQHSFIKAMLKQGMTSSYTLHWAANLKDGLITLSQQPMDLLILDLMLPDSREMHTFTQVHSRNWAGRRPNNELTVGRCSRAVSESN